MLSDRIKRERQKKGISMRQAAMEMGFPYTTYVNYEKGISEPNSEGLVKIAVFYNVSADYLLGRHEEEARVIQEDIEQSVMEDVEIGMGASLRHPLTKMDQSERIIIAQRIIIDPKTKDAFADPIHTANPYAQCYIAPVKKLEDYCFYEIDDDSMAPFLEIHDYVLIELNTQIDSGDCAVISLDGKCLIRKIEFDDDMKEWRITAYNRYYPPITIKNSERSRLIIAGRIDRVIRLMPRGER